MILKMNNLLKKHYRFNIFLKKILNSLNTKKYIKPFKEIIYTYSMIKIICHIYI
jgi:hypothetical protein